MKHRILYFYHTLLQEHLLHQAWCETKFIKYRENKLIVTIDKVCSKYPPLARTQACRHVGHWLSVSSISDCSKLCHTCSRHCCSSSMSLTLCLIHIRFYIDTNDCYVAFCYSGKYCDAEDTSRVPDSGDFMPFMRTSEVLDPAHADSPLPVSREPTDMVKARRAYQRELNPAKYGHAMDHRVNLHVSMTACVFLSSVECAL